MNRHLTYRPQTAHIPADSLLGNPCDSRDPRRSMNPLTGIWPACATVPGYRYASPNGENNDGSRPTANYSLLTANSLTFTFSAKEKDSETDLSYFGSRYYSSDLSIWLSVDPMAGKYPSLSPYVYCADNPVKLVDPDGEEIEIVITIDENGNKIITINFTAKIVNKSSHPFSKRKMERMRDEILKHYFENYRHNHH